MSDEASDELAERRKRLAPRWTYEPDTVESWRERAYSVAEQLQSATAFIESLRDRHVWIPTGKKRPVCKLCGTATDPDAPDDPLQHGRDYSCGLAQNYLGTVTTAVAGFSP